MKPALASIVLIIEALDPKNSVKNISIGEIYLGDYKGEPTCSDKIKL